MRKMGNMKAKICLAAVVLSGSLMIAFAAEKKTEGTAKTADACTEKYEKDLLSCENQRANCKARGSDPGTCDQRYNQCANPVIKAFNECQGVSNPGGKAPGKQPGKKS